MTAFLLYNVEPCLYRNQYFTSHLHIRILQNIVEPREKMCVIRERRILSSANSSFYRDIVHSDHTKKGERVKMKQEQILIFFFQWKKEKNLHIIWGIFKGRQLTFIIINTHIFT